MTSAVYWITSPFQIRLAIIPRPEGNDSLTDELKALRASGVDIIVSMLDRLEAIDLGLRDERAECYNAGITFIDHPTSDRGVPASKQAYSEFLNQLRAYLDSGKSIGIHCRAGIGRSSLLAAALLCSYGMKPADAFPLIAQCRGCEVPDTKAQIRWVEDFTAGSSPK